MLTVLIFNLTIMKEFTAVLLILLLSSAIVVAQKRAKTPLKLLKTIHKLINAKKYDKLQKYLYQGKLSYMRDTPEKAKDKTVADMIIYGIKAGKERHGDFSYNAKNLQFLIDKQAKNIKPVPDKLRQEIFGNKDNEFGRFPDLRALAQQRPQDIYMLEYKEVHIIMVKIKKGFRLVFWENLNNMPEKG